MARNPHKVEAEQDRRSAAEIYADIRSPKWAYSRAHTESLRKEAQWYRRMALNLERLARSEWESERRWALWRKSQTATIHEEIISYRCGDHDFEERISTFLEQHPNVMSKQHVRGITAIATFGSTDDNDRFQVRLFLKDGG